MRQSKCFLNVSNHPISQWSEKQKLVALEYGDLLEIPFPCVDERGGELYIADLTEKLLNQIDTLTVDYNDVIVHVMGEFCLTFSLVKALQSKGVICVASTTKRIVTETDEGKKEVTFEFERFRKYINIENS